jgi:hypothetical protein
MNQLGSFAGSAQHLARVVHESAIGVGMAPIPMVIVVSLMALYAMGVLFVGATGGRPRGAHRVRH